MVANATPVKSSMIRKHSLGFVASALALAVSAQAFAGTVTTDGADIVIKTRAASSRHH